MKNLLGFVKENKKTIGLLAGAIATLIVGKKVSKKINAKMEKVEKEYEEMDKIIETTHEMNLPEYSEDDYNNDKKINTTKKVVKKIGLTIGKLCISSIPSIIVMIDHCYRIRQASLQEGTTEGEKMGYILGLLPASVLWYAIFRAIQ